MDAEIELIKKRLTSLTQMSVNNQVALLPRALLRYSSLDNPNPMRYKGSMSAVVRIAIGVVCLFGFTLAALLFFYAANPWMERVGVPLLG